MVSKSSESSYINAIIDGEAKRPFFVVVIFNSKLEARIGFLSQDLEKAHKFAHEIRNLELGQGIRAFGSIMRLDAARAHFTAEVDQFLSRLGEPV